jgi:plasmid stabilization system protein ParE
MEYRVALAETAQADVERIYRWVTSEAPERGPDWFEELIESVDSLERFPARCPMAREANESKQGIRCLLFGKRHGVYRILYETDETQDGLDSAYPARRPPGFDDRRVTLHAAMSLGLNIYQLQL